MTNYNSKSTSSATATSGSSWGCLPLILTVIVLYAVCCGVTYKGRHYDLTCSCDRGVAVDESAADR